ncbi:MAG: hypothetical protein CUN55_17725, partial [Phototrophicales bacterium]
HMGHDSKVNFRGFAFRGVGPRYANNAIGGELFYSLTTMLTFPLFNVIGNIGLLKGKFFVQTGSLINISPKLGGVFHHTGELIEKSRITMGGGLAMRTALGVTFEALLTYPLRYFRCDQPVPYILGFSFSLSR